CAHHRDADRLTGLTAGGTPVGEDRLDDVVEGVLDGGGHAARPLERDRDERPPVFGATACRARYVSRSACVNRTRRPRRRCGTSSMWACNHVTFTPRRRAASAYPNGGSCEDIRQPSREPRARSRG